MSKRVLIPFRHAKKLQPYEDAARAGGIEPVAVNVSDRILLEGVAGLLLMGGTDVNPNCYHATPQPETDPPDDERDRVELELIGQAIGRDLPIFAICRGLQIMNVYHGGTLIQHLSPGARHDVETVDKASPAHEVVIERDSLLGRIAEVKEWQVNSRHHQAADRVGAGLRVVARDMGHGTVEGLEREDKRFVVAVQWHPEDQVARFPEQLKLFRKFAEAL